MGNNYRHIYKKMRLKYGIDEQEDVFVEELSELIKEIIKKKRYRGFPDEFDYNHIAHEVADVEIVISQMKYFYNIDSMVKTWKKIKRRKLRRMALK